MGRFALREDEIELFRRRLCDVATRRFAELGIAGVSLRGLADELGCSRATPYRYFQNKDEIFAAVRARAFAQLAAACDEATALEPDAERRLMAIGHAYLRFARDEPHAYRVAFELDQPDAETYPELLRARASAWGVMRKAVQHAFLKGMLEGDPETICHLYWAGLHGLAALELAGQLQSRTLDELEGPMIESLLRGTRIATRGHASVAPPFHTHPSEKSP